MKTKTSHQEQIQEPGDGTRDRPLSKLLGHLLVQGRSLCQVSKTDSIIIIIISILQVGEVGKVGINAVFGWCHSYVDKFPKFGNDMYILLFLIKM